MTGRVLDTSAILAYLWQEPGWDKARGNLATNQCAMSLDTTKEG